MEQLSFLIEWIAEDATAKCETTYNGTYVVFHKKHFVLRN